MRSEDRCWPTAAKSPTRFLMSSSRGSWGMLPFFDSAAACRSSPYRHGRYCFPPSLYRVSLQIGLFSEPCWLAKLFLEETSMLYHLPVFIGAFTTSPTFIPDGLGPSEIQRTMNHFLCRTFDRMRIDHCCHEPSAHLTQG